MEWAQILWQGLWIGTGATIFLDLAAAVRRRIFQTPTLDYALVGRWVLLMRRGKFRHHPIMSSPPQAMERTVGWAFHFGTGIVFAVILLCVMGPEWGRAPTPGPALITGVLSVAAPFFIMQPAFGFGIAGAATPNPWMMRARGFVTHLLFGLGLYISALLFSAF